MTTAEDRATSPHDSLFKAVFAHPAQAALLLRLAIPEPLLADLGLPGLLERRNEHVDPDLHQSRSDVVFELALPGEGPPLQLVAEHQSRPERDVAYVGCAYMERLRDRWIRSGGSRTALPPGLAVVLYQGPGAWPAPRRLRELIALPAGPLGEFLEPFQTEQRLCLIELGLLDYARLRALEAPAAGVLALMLLKAAPSKDLGPAWKAAGELVSTARRESPALFLLLVR